MSFTSSPNAPREIKPFTLLQEAVSEVGPIYLPLIILISPTIVLQVVQVLAPDLKVVVSLVNAFILTPIFSSAGIYFVYRYIQSETVDIQGAFTQALGNLGNLAVGFLLTVLSVMAGFLGLIIPGIYLAIQLSFVLYAITIEGDSGIDGMKSSWALVKGRWWPVFGSVILPQLFIFIPIAAVGVIAGVLFGRNATPVASILGAVMGLLVTPILSLYFVKVYLRLKAIAAA